MSLMQTSPIEIRFKHPNYSKVSVQRSFISDEERQSSQRRELNISAEEEMEAVEQKSDVINVGCKQNKNMRARAVGGRKEE